MRSARSLIATLLLMAAPAVFAQQVDSLVAPYPASECASCAEWNAPRAPFRLFGNTFFVGTEGLTALLIASAEGHVLIDGALPDSAPRILENVKALGFDPKDVVLILNSHPHFDHAGGIAALQRATGARVAASANAVAVLERGRAADDDPQLGAALDFPPSRGVERFAYGATLKGGSTSLTAWPGGGHAPGGTTWSWTSCEGARCLRMVYADSLTPLTVGNFRYSASAGARAEFEKGYAALEGMPCDILLTPHPGASSMWERVAKGADGLVEAGACRAYAARGREQLAKKLAQERGEK